MKKHLFIFVVLILAGGSVFAAEKFLASPKSSPSSPAPAESAPAPSNPSSFSGVIHLMNNVVDALSPSASQTSTSPIQTSAIANSPADNTPFSFAVFGDTKSFSVNDPNGNLEKAVAQMKNQVLKAVFVMGDLINSCDGGNSCVSKYNDWKSIMSPLLSKTYEVVGNHDRTGGEKADAVWQKEFSLPQNGPDGYKDLVYSFDIGNSHFAVLDSEKPKGNVIDSTQRAWLDQDLAATAKEHKFVFYHEPAFQAAQDAEDGLDADPSERDAFWNIIKKYEVDAVFNGHAHIYARKNIGGIEQIVVGDTDSTNDDIVQPGLSDFGYKGKSYAIVTVNGKNINLKLFTVDGKQVDSFDFT
ncbi:MAG: metallophosphoesterase [Candidatus Moranbacteria bacterium]|nr:metallophosphoesterase [Candidatus Moranbacteria bacterium]